MKRRSLAKFAKGTEGSKSHEINEDDQRRVDENGISIFIYSTSRRDVIYVATPVKALKPSQIAFWFNPGLSQRFYKVEKRAESFWR